MKTFPKCDPCHSTESALVKVHDDILRPLDNLNSVILLLLHLSAASDTVDHNILLSRLKPRFGINGIALDWFRSDLPTGLTMSLFWVVDLLSDLSWPVCHNGVSWSLYYSQCKLHLLEMLLVYMTWVTIFMWMTPSSMSLFKQLVLMVWTWRDPA